MKTQIIALEAHDDFISVRDRMSWAKTRRILLVWPKYESIALRTVDLRILQQHASQLGAEMGIVTRRADVRRDAQGLGIPVFASTATAQREAWPARKEGQKAALERPARSREELRSMRLAAHPPEASWKTRPAARIGFFLLGVLAALAVAAVFLPTATITVTPESQQQSIRVPVTAAAAAHTVSLTGSLPAYEITVTAGAAQSAQVGTQSVIPDQPARGIARFTNLTQSDLTIPAGTIVYSLSPAAVQFATQNDTHLPGNVNAAVEVPIASLNAGSEANLPANAIQAIQGSLGLSAAVTNPQATTGGTDRMAAAPSEADRQRLHEVVVELLTEQAKSLIRSSVGAQDVLLPATLKMGQVLEEKYDPAAGKPGTLLSLSMRAQFEVQFLKGEDLAQLAEGVLDGARAQGFSAVPGTFSYTVGGASVDATGSVRFDLDVRRELVRNLDTSRAAMLARGRSPQAAAQAIQQALELPEPPGIQISPAWLRWLPVVPFRVSVAVGS